MWSMLNKSILQGVEKLRVCEWQVINKDLLQGIGGFLDLYDERAVSLDGAVQEVDNEYKTASEEMAAIQRNLDELRYSQRTEEK